MPAKRTRWKLIKSVVFCLGLLVMLLCIESVMMPAVGSVDAWPAVSQTRGEVDVIALGSSRTYCTVSPMEMWRQSGVTALDVTSGTQPLSVTASYLEQALLRQHPKVVFLELYMVGRSDTFTLERAHTNLDYMPFGIPRAAGIVRSTPPSQWFDLFVPLQTYHSRWSVLTRSDFSRDKLDRGAYARGAMYLPQVSTVATQTTRDDIGEAAYLRDLPHIRKIAQLCEKSGAKLVLFTSPSPYVMWVADQSLLERVSGDLVQQYPKTLFLDMNQLIGSLGIDPASDYKDSLHLNQRGAVKVSRWLADSLVKEYGLADRRGDSFAGHWNEDLREYDKVFKSGW